MDMLAVLIVMGAIFIWGVVSPRVTRADLSAPIVFVAVGGVLAALMAVAVSCSLIRVLILLG
ncbi:MAG: hypothetical protein ACXWW1_03325 [Aeromicrobium sp.]